MDLRTVSFDVPPQEVRSKEEVWAVRPGLQVLSRDSVTVTVDAVIYYRVSNPTMVTRLTLEISWNLLLKATNNVEDFSHSTHLLGATTLRSDFDCRSYFVNWAVLRNVLGTKCLAEILSEREKIAQVLVIILLCNVPCTALSSGWRTRWTRRRTPGEWRWSGWRCESGFLNTGCR